MSYRRSRCSGRRVSLTLLMIGAVFRLASPLEAGVVFTNIAGNCCGGEGITGANYGRGLAAEAFDPAESFVMSDAMVEVFQVEGFGGDPYFNLSLYSNAGGVPGTLITTMGTGLTAPVGGGLVKAGGPLTQLTAGAEYWLVLSPFDNATEVGWEGGGVQPALVAVLGADSWANFGGSTSNLQFQIDAVPEPASSGLVAASLIWIALRGAALPRKSKTLSGSRSV